MVITHYACDFCEKRGEGLGTRPKGWFRSRWIPGILVPPGRQPPQPPDRHYCTEACMQADQARRAEDDPDLTADLAAAALVHDDGTGGS